MSSRHRERRLRNLAVWRIGNAALMPFDNGRGELASKTVTIPQASWRFVGHAMTGCSPSVAVRSSDHDESSFDLCRDPSRRRQE